MRRELLKRVLACACLCLVIVVAAGGRLARDAVVVVDRPAEGVSRRYFFDAQTGLLLRIVQLTETVLNPLPEQTDFEDYRDVEGVRLPFIVRVSAVDTFDSFTRRITDVRPGAAVDDKAFEMPAPAPAAELYPDTCDDSI